jgi:hypothetical protein
MVLLLLAHGAQRDALPDPDDLVPDDFDDVEWEGAAETWATQYAATAQAGEKYAYFFDQAHVRQLLSSTRGFTPLHFLDVHTASRTRELLHDGGSPLVRATTIGAPSPLDVARRIERDGRAVAGSAAVVVLSWWRCRLAAFAMGTHARLGQQSPVRHLSGMAEICELIAMLVAS